MRRATTAEVIAHTRITGSPGAHTSARVITGHRRPLALGGPGIGAGAV
ncbi:MAG TPA: hypothetical protein VGL33_05775 [Streptosporangiaceae bacterium]